MDTLSLIESNLKLVFNFFKTGVLNDILAEF